MAALSGYGARSSKDEMESLGATWGMRKGLNGLLSRGYVLVAMLRSVFNFLIRIAKRQRQPCYTCMGDFRSSLDGMSFSLAIPTVWTLVYDNIVLCQVIYCVLRLKTH